MEQVLMYLNYVKKAKLAYGLYKVRKSNSRKFQIS